VRRESPPTTRGWLGSENTGAGLSRRLRAREGDAQRERLPQESAHDLAFRHTLDICARGQRPVFGTPTDTLWLSDDQGDAWQTLSTHLPPIDCVRLWPDLRGTEVGTIASEGDSGVGSRA